MMKDTSINSCNHLLSILLVSLGFVAFSVLPCWAQGQTLQFDWASRPANVGQSVNAPTLEIGSPENIKFKIISVNDIFYSYTMSCVGTPKEAPDLTDWFKLIGGQQLEAAPGPCDGSAQTLLQEISKYLKSSGECGTGCDSKPLKETLQQLEKYDGQVQQLLGGTCSAPVQQTLSSTHETLQKLIKLPHDVSFQQTISPDEDYLCTVTESINGQPTKGGTLTINVKPANEILALSIGPMFSGLQNRTYSAVMVPNATSSGTNTVLAVQGRSLSTSVAALVNVRLPVRAISTNRVGIDFSAGPVVRLSSGGGTSPAGFFGGLSLRLYRYLFITPGFHVGQFADFPQGFSFAGQKIPPNFGTPQPVTRTTVKFGIAISFQTKDFKSLGKSTATTTNPPSSPPGSQAAKNQTPKPEIPAQQPANGTVTITPAQELDFGTLGTTAVTKSIEIRNDKSTEVKLTFDPQSQTGVRFSQNDLQKCTTIPADSKCTVAVTLQPEAGDPASVLNIAYQTGEQLAAVKLMWKKAGQ